MLIVVLFLSRGVYADLPDRLSHDDVARALRVLPCHPYIGKAQGWDTRFVPALSGMLCDTPTPDSPSMQRMWWFTGDVYVSNGWLPAPGDPGVVAVSVDEAPMPPEPRGFDVAPAKKEEASMPLGCIAVPIALIVVCGLVVIVRLLIAREQEQAYQRQQEAAWERTRRYQEAERAQRAEELRRREKIEARRIAPLIAAQARLAQAAARFEEMRARKKSRPVGGLQ